MQFKHTPPTQSGYYWVVDVSYPQPFIAFIQSGFLHMSNGHPYDLRTNPISRSNDGLQIGYRFGDMLSPPEQKDVHISDD
jgi:hypothetical protein